MLETALIILTLGAGGGTQLALSVTESPEDCAARAEVLEQVLTGSGYTILGMRCGQTPLALSPYSHGHDADDMRWLYRVTLKGSALADGFDLAPVEAGQCAETAPGIHCAISAQEPLAD